MQGVCILESMLDVRNDTLFEWLVKDEDLVDSLETRLGVRTPSPPSLSLSP